MKLCVWSVKKNEEDAFELRFTRRRFELVSLELSKEPQDADTFAAEFIRSSYGHTILMWKSLAYGELTSNCKCAGHAGLLLQERETDFSWMPLWHARELMNRTCSVLKSPEHAAQDGKTMQVTAVDGMLSFQATNNSPSRLVHNEYNEWATQGKIQTKWQDNNHCPKHCSL